MRILFTSRIGNCDTVYGVTSVSSIIFFRTSSESFTSVRCFENLDVLRCQNNAIPRCVIYIRVYPWVTHPRMHIKVGGFAKVCMPFFLCGRFSSTRTRDSVFMATLNGNRCFTCEPAMRYTEETQPIRLFCFYVTRNHFINI